MLQALCAVGAHHKVLYVSGEESSQQIALRAKRLSLDASVLHQIAEIGLEKIQHVLQTEKPAVAVIDSIQTLYSDALQSAPGSVAQVRECAAQLPRLAQSSGTTVILVGHVTKEGAPAGPRVLDHRADTGASSQGAPPSTPQPHHGQGASFESVRSRVRTLRFGHVCICPHRRSESPALHQQRGAFSVLIITPLSPGSRVPIARTGQAW